jgi:hypothetical protein
MFNIFIEFGRPPTLVITIKMRKLCKIRICKYLSETFSALNDLRKRDALTQSVLFWLHNMPIGRSRKPARIDMDEAHQILDYFNSINLLCIKIYTKKMNKFHWTPVSRLISK